MLTYSTAHQGAAPRIKGQHILVWLQHVVTKMPNQPFVICAFCEARQCMAVCVKKYVWCECGWTLDLISITGNKFETLNVSVLRQQVGTPMQFAYSSAGRWKKTQTNASNCTSWKMAPVTETTTSKAIAAIFHWDAIAQCRVTHLRHVHQTSHVCCN